MKITVLCSDSMHPVNLHLKKWADKHKEHHTIEIVDSVDKLTEGDFLFLVSCSDIVPKSLRQKYQFCLVLHASDLPKGRGWSPHIWEIINGADYITISLLEAEDRVDSGRIWLKRYVDIPKTALWDEINERLFNTEMEMLTDAIENFESITPKAQPTNTEPSYYRKRTPEDSQIDVNKPISDQFDLLRVCDPNRFPAWFIHRGQKYKLIIEKVDNE